uniref:RNA cytidine acetyltransferase n=1 Tax=Hirondellea gigas TaxID=1518452 RepID=A0A6A7GF83_9CRUS
MRKKVDSRIRTLIENGVKLNQRSFFVLVGDKGRDQIVNLHYILSKSRVKARPSVLWCYKKDLGFSSHRKKRAKQVRRDIQRGLRTVDENDPFDLFIACTSIRYVFYKDTHKILGQTHEVCILQDFEAVTPNLLARTIETVAGGGLVILLLKTMTSLKQLYQMTMDVHSRYRTSAHQDVVCRFNERFLLSLGSCQNCLVVDDELNVLSISSHVHNIKPVALPNQGGDSVDAHLSPSQNELNILKVELKESQPIGALVDLCRTLDQAKAVLTFAEAILEKTIRSTVALTAARGRGKSAALGISIAAAIAHGYSNIFVTCPSPENLGTLFEMLFKGFDALEYKEHLDYEVVQSTNPEFNKAVVRVNVFRKHRQTVQYIQPGDHLKLSQAELLVVDEAAAIPLTLVKKLMGPYVVFLSSTINGYEGTGRSLSLKLIKDLRERCHAKASSLASSSSSGSSNASQTLREIELDEPIRYSMGDPVERWLTDLLCFDCSGKGHRIVHGTPHPSKTELYRVNRDTLFSYHKASEGFLLRMMSLYVSSHYKNSPDDLQLMSDAPAHRLFVLLGPIQENSVLPDILCVIQVALEGEISRESVKRSLGRGLRASGDLIPWTLCQQFQDLEFGSLSGIRIVRIATHPDVQKMGYGRRALELLTSFYDGSLNNLLDENENISMTITDEVQIDNSIDQSNVLRTESLKPRSNLPPLLEPVDKLKPEALHWIGVSFGLTPQLFSFWERNQFNPVYLRQTANTLTGEHTAIMLKTLSGTSVQRVPNSDWLTEFSADFRCRFLSLLSYQFRSFTTSLALSVLNLSPNLVTSKRGLAGATSNSSQGLTYSELRQFVSEYDLRRLESYASHLVDYHMIIDLVPSVARLFFLERLSDVSLTMGQCAILLGIGLQHRTVSDLEKELPINSSQILAFFNQIIRKISNKFRSIAEKEIEDDISKKKAVQVARRVRFDPVQQSLHDDMKEGADKANLAMEKQQSALIQSIKDLDMYHVGGTNEDWSGALTAGHTPSTISVKGTRKSDEKERSNSSNSSKKSKKNRSHSKKKQKRRKVDHEKRKSSGD